MLNVLLRKLQEYKTNSIGGYEAQKMLIRAISETIKELDQEDKQQS